jgi:hypothetical protein
MASSDPTSVNYTRHERVPQGKGDSYLQAGLQVIASNPLDRLCSHRLSPVLKSGLHFSSPITVFIAE